MSEQPVSVNHTETVEVRDGRMAYTVYGDAVGGTTPDGRPIPPWDALGEKVQGGWTAVGTAFRQRAELDRRTVETPR